MNEKDLEFGELNLEDIMKEFGADVDASDADLEDTQDLLAAINGIEEMTAEQESDPEETENQEPEQEAAEEPAAEETAEPAEPAQPVPEEPVEETQEMDDTVRLDDLSQITGTTPSVGHKLEDKTERLDPIADEDEDSVEIKIPAPIVFRPKQRLRELKGRTVLAVTHRPAALALADLQLEVSNGEIQTKRREEHIDGTA